MKEVYFIIGQLANGGAERAVSNLSFALSDKFICKAVLYGKQYSNTYPFNGDVILLDDKQYSSKLKQMAVFFNRIVKINKLKRENANAIFISFLEFGNLFNLLGSSGNAVVSVRNHMSSKFNRGVKAAVWRFIIRKLYRRAELIIAVSKEIKRDLVENFNLDAQKIKVVYNSYPLTEIDNRSREAIKDNHLSRLFETHKVIITAGRLNKQKGQWHLIRSFKLIKERIPESKLVILGKGPLKRELMELTTKLGLRNDVLFLGFQSNPFQYIARSKVFVLSSLYEGFPNALVEAMACGIPVVSTDCFSGPREIIAPGDDEYGYKEDHYGVLIPRFDEQSYYLNSEVSNEEKYMAESIIELLSDGRKWEELSKKAKKRSMDFDGEKYAELWRSVIDNHV